jgi:uncharacterized membrane protein
LPNDWDFGLGISFGFRISDFGFARFPIAFITTLARIRAALPNPQDHLRKTFVAGLFTVVPVAITIFLVYKFDQLTRQILQGLFGWSVPLVGALIAVAVIYFSGLLASSLVGRFFIGILDALVVRVPVLRQLYTAWKQVAFVPAGTEGTFSKVVLIGDETSQLLMLGFCSGVPIEGDPDTFCVFMPSAPNPVGGSRLFFVPREKIVWLNVSTEEAFKVVLSNGNYVPKAVGEAIAAAKEEVKNSKFLVQS